MNTVPLKIYIIFSQPDDLALHSRSQLRLKLDIQCLTRARIVLFRTRYLSYGIQTWHDGRLMHGIPAHAILMTLTLFVTVCMQKQNKSVLNNLDN